MNTNLQNLVSVLPEVYQTIYGHNEWDGDVSRDCSERLDIIAKNYLTLSKKLNRPLRVLDLGCAQGFFSLSLASLGASVHGIDFLQENINVCNALADENRTLTVTFQKGRIEEIIETIEPGHYDFVIGLSVFHHIVHEHGIERVKSWLLKLANSVHVIILELALKSEPLYWAVSQPTEPRELIEQCSFYQQIAHFSTHLSNISRPMFIISNDYLIINDYCEKFYKWSLNPYEDANSVHKGSRRYFFGKDVVCKLYHFSTLSGTLLPAESERNLVELKQEISFLKTPPPGFPVPKLFLGGYDVNQGWLVMERFEGILLLERISQEEILDVDGIFSQLLEQLVILEKNGLYHDDIRTWNILVDDSGELKLIDYGSISSQPKDCVWPDNIFQSFCILVNEILNPKSTTGGFLRPAALSPFNLPEVYASWLSSFWSYPVAEWSFALLLELFHKRKELPKITDLKNGLEIWIGASEKVTMHNQSHIHQVDALMNECRARVENIELHLEHGLSEKIAQIKKDNDINIEKIESQISSSHGRIQQIEQLVNESIIQKIDFLKEQGLIFEKALLEYKNIIASDGNNQELTLLPHEVLQVKITEAEQRIDRLAAENSALQTQIQLILQSRSWKMTAWWRTLGHPIKNFIVKPKRHVIKSGTKIFLIKTASYIKNRPLLKKRVLKGLSFTGLYPLSIKLYQRVFPINNSEPISVELPQEDILTSYKDNTQLPSLVEEIYLKIKR